jgi:hypothetical protein
VVVRKRKGKRVGREGRRRGRREGGRERKPGEGRGGRRAEWREKEEREESEVEEGEILEGGRGITKEEGKEKVREGRDPTMRFCVTGKKKKSRGGPNLLSRPIICICNDQ